MATNGSFGGQGRPITGQISCVFLGASSTWFWRRMIFYRATWVAMVDSGSISSSRHCVQVFVIRRNDMQVFGPRLLLRTHPYWYLVHSFTCAHLFRTATSDLRCSGLPRELQGHCVLESMILTGACGRFFTHTGKLWESFFRFWFSSMCSSQSFSLATKLL